MVEFRQALFHGSQGLARPEHFFQVAFRYNPTIVKNGFQNIFISNLNMDAGWVFCPAKSW
jgi:hypothetical protein